MCLIFLTCPNQKQADQISNTLLSKKLIVCCKKTPVSSSFLWKSKIDSSKEVLLIMESKEELFSKIEYEVRKVHTYETFVMIAVPILKASKGIQKWMEKELLK